MQTSSVQTQFLDPEALAERWGVSVATVYRWRSEGRDLPRALKIGQAVRWRISEVERWEDAHEGEVASA